jgi:integrase
MKSKSFWSVFAPHIRQFIEQKRSLGYKYDEQERVLFSFDQFVLDQDYTISGLTKEIADKWAERRYNESAITIYAKVLVIKQFSEFLRHCGIQTYVPNLPKYPNSTYIPYIYTHDEMTEIFIACDNLRMKHRNVDSCLLIMPCLLRLLYSTGTRIGEALSLKNKDVDIIGKCLILRNTKNGKDRLVPMSDSLAAVCKDYLEHRNNLSFVSLNSEHGPFFVSLNGGFCKYNTVFMWFRKVLFQAGIPFAGNRKGPTIHSFRHSFACHSFVKLSNEGVDLYCSWPYLSTYLGHQSLQSTEQYIRLTAQMYPELLKDTDALYVDVLPDVTLKTNDQL